MSDEHARLLAAVHVRRELAERATPGPWDANVYHVLMDGGGDARIYPPGKPAVVLARFSNSADPHHIAANDPAQILRDTEAHLKILKRHRPGSLMPSGRRMCSCAHRHYTPYVEECDAIQDLAGIYPQENET